MRDARRKSIASAVLLLYILIMLPAIITALIVSCASVNAQPLKGSVSAVDESMRPGAIYEPVRKPVEFYRIPALFAGTFKNRYSTYTTGVQDYNGKIYGVLGGDPQVSPGRRETQYTTQTQRETLYIDRLHFNKRSLDTVVYVDNKTHKVKRTLQIVATSEATIQPDGTVVTTFGETEVYSDTGRFLRTQPGYTLVNTRIAPYARDNRYSSAFADWIQARIKNKSAP